MTDERPVPFHMLFSLSAFGEKGISMAIAPVDRVISDDDFHAGLYPGDILTYSDETNLPEFWSSMKNLIDGENHTGCMTVLCVDLNGDRRSLDIERSGESIVFREGDGVIECIPREGVQSLLALSNLSRPPDTVLRLQHSSDVISTTFDGVLGAYCCLSFDGGGYRGKRGRMIVMFDGKSPDSDIVRSASHALAYLEDPDRICDQVSSRIERPLGDEDKSRLRHWCRFAISALRSRQHELGTNTLSTESGTLVCCANGDIRMRRPDQMVLDKAHILELANRGDVVRVQGDYGGAAVFPSKGVLGWLDLPEPRAARSIEYRLAESVVHTSWVDESAGVRLSFTRTSDVSDSRNQELRIKLSDEREDSVVVDLSTFGHALRNGDLSEAHVSLRSLPFDKNDLRDMEEWVACTSRCVTQEGVSLGR